MKDNLLVARGDFRVSMDVVPEFIDDIVNSNVSVKPKFGRVEDNDGAVCASTSKYYDQRFAAE
jgi:hypothetical protein